MDKQLFGILIAIAMSTLGALGDYFIKRASYQMQPIWNLWFVMGLAVFAMSAFGWLYVMMHVKLAVVGVVYAISTVLLLALCGTFLFQESLSGRDMCAIFLAVAALAVLVIGVETPSTREPAESRQRDTAANVFIDNCRFGRGVFAARFIQKDESILRFDGRRVTRFDLQTKGERGADALQIDRDEYLELNEPGGLVNHSCRPNAGIRAGNQLVALRDIEKNEEIFFDYSTTIYEDCWTMKCCCLTPQCRGTIGEFRQLPESLQGHYLKLGIVQPFIASAIQSCVSGSGGEIAQRRDGFRQEV